MRAYTINESQLAFRLALQLVGLVQKAHASLNPTNNEHYATVKAAILHHYNINEEAFQQRFCNVHFKPGQSPTEVVMALSDLAG